VTPATSGTAANRRGPHAQGPLTPLPLPLRVCRWTRVTLHVVQGLLTVGVVFPLVGSPRRQGMIAGWSRHLLRLLRVEARIHGLPGGGLPDQILIVANHVSWLDIFVLNALQPSRFIAKAELDRWPLVRHLMIASGTLFIDRRRRRDTREVNRQVAEAIAAGDVIVVFPEGTTTDGRDVLPFHGSLLQPIVDIGGQVQPISIRYFGPDGHLSDVPAYIGDQTFAQSFWQVTGARTLTVELHIGTPLPARERHRRDLSRAAEAAIRKALALPERGSAPGTPADPRA
jgi:1-acyl-sn-glycerol-3-phosphate acyltransferase